MAAAEQMEPYPTLGIIAGSGDLPLVMAQACEQSGQPYHLFAIEDAASGDYLNSVPHSWIRLGGLGKAIKALQEHGVHDIVMAGRVERPKLSALRPDLKATQLLAKLGSNFLTGDDTLLRGIISFLEDEGFTVLSVEDVVHHILAPEGMLGIVYPDKNAQVDINFGVEIAREIGRMDIGQSVVVHNTQVLGVEAIEGTDALLQRCSKYKQEAGGVLVKIRKPQQERRADLPTIGLKTIQGAIEANLSGIAIEAGSTLVLDKRELIRTANEEGLFIVGFTVEENTKHDQSS